MVVVTLHSKEEHELRKLNASRRTDQKESMRETLRNASDNIKQLSSPCSLLIVRASNEIWINVKAMPCR